MKPASPSRPRLACRLARTCVTAFGDDNAQSGPGSRHIAACPRCQEFFAACDDLDSALRLAAAPYQAAPDTGFEQRLLRAVRMSEPEPRRAHPRAAWLSFAGVAACAAVAAVVFNRPAPTNTAPSPKMTAASTVTDVLIAASSLSDRMWNSLKPSAVALAEKNPLEEELSSVYSDARSALGFLALNFFPTDITRSPSDQEPSDTSHRG